MIVNTAKQGGNQNRGRKSGLLLQRKLLINYRVQFILVGHTVLVAVITAIQAHLAHLTRISDTIQLPLLGPVPTMALVWIPMPLLVIALLWGFSVSNRIVGPIFNLERHLQKILDGEIDQPARCRGTDFFPGLFAEVNRLLEEREALRRSRPLGKVD